MNQPYNQTGRVNIEQDQQAEELAQETAEQITGPLTGQAVAAERTVAPKINAEAPGAKPQAKKRKAASAFRTISEVAEILDVQQHVLRFWETKFSQIRPLKRGGGRRYYRPEDLELLKKIHHLLYTEGYTIKGVQKLLREKGKAAVLQEKPQAQNNNEPVVSASVKGSIGNGVSSKQRSAIKSMVAELKELRQLIKPE